MSHGKQASTKRKRSINALPVLSAAGLSLSLASGASAAIGKPAADVLTPKTEMSHEITLCEEEISDVSLATFYIFDNERAGTSRRGLKLAQGCGGCGCPCIPVNRLSAFQAHVLESGFARIPLWLLDFSGKRSEVKLSSRCRNNWFQPIRTALFKIIYATIERN
jgi:hypothetical protein